MGTKGKLTLYVDVEVVKEAKELGLNISKVCENALKEAIKRLKGEYLGTERRQNPVSNKKWCRGPDLNRRQPGLQPGALPV